MTKKTTRPKRISDERLAEAYAKANRLYEAFLPGRLRQLRPASDSDLMNAADLIERLTAELKKVRAEALEEAAMVCDQVAKSEQTMRDKPRNKDKFEWGSMHAFAAATLVTAADAIRALKVAL